MSVAQPSSELAAQTVWAVDRIKDHVSKIGSGITPTGGAASYLVAGIPLLRSQNVHFDGLRLDDVAYIAEETHEEMSGTKLRARDVLLNITGASIGRCAFVPDGFGEGNVNQHVCIIRPAEKLNYKFLNYCLSAPWGQDQVFSSFTGASRQGLGRRDLGEIQVPLPPLPEQQRIAAYLDASCAAIDAAVGAKRRQLETLDALRKSTIKRAVTRGLNPSVKTKRTDVEWIPEMPEHWRLVRVKDVIQFFNTVRVPLSAAERGVMTEKTYDYYGASGVIDKVEAYLFDGTYILIAEDGANLLTRSKPLAFLAKGQFWVNNHAHILKPRWGGDDTFFVNLLESQDFSLFVTGAAQPKLTMENLGRFNLAVPRVAEQKEIAAFIHEKDAEFRRLFAQIERQTETLVIYRKSLIHECVTGQRRITESDAQRAASQRKFDNLALTG
jgi:type I restriction enzyme S subunit